jgi:peptide/nickel transport system substrate-binding protein
MLVGGHVTIRTDRAYLPGLALLGGLLAACSAPPAAPATVIVGHAADVIGLDPARITDAESAEVTEQIFDHLVRYRHDSTEVEPALATAWDVSADGRVWTFHLRRGVLFHDGTAFDADAVVFSLDRQRDPRHPFHQADFNYWETTFRNIQSVEKLDALTVRITIERPYAPFLSNLAMFPVSIVSPAAVKRWGAEFAKHPVGTGPFRFAEWSAGERVTLEANPSYWDGTPRIRNLVFSVIRDERQRLVALEGGAIDVAENLAPQDLQFVALHPDLELHRVPGNNVGYLAMNVQHPPFDDVRVRRAVNYAVNKAAIVRLIYQGLAQEATTAVPPSLWGHQPGPSYGYDPQKAQRLLAEAGWKQPLRRPKLYTMATARPYIASPETVARIIQHNLHDVGMDVEVVAAEMDVHLRAVQRGEHDLCLLGWSADNGDPDNFLYQLFDPENAEPGSARNVAFYRNAELHGILTWAQESVDQHERDRFYRRAQDLIARDAPWVPLAHAEIVVATRASVAGLVVHPSATLRFQRVYRR